MSIIDTSAPLVSVVMPAYNSSRYIEVAMRSALNQTLDDLELIVVDDASTDGTLEIAQSVARADDRVVLQPSVSNRGAAEARNTALGLARGHYVAFLDSDDLWEPDKLEQQLERMRVTGLSICACSYYMRLEGADEKGDGSATDAIFHVPHRITYEDILRVSYFSCSTLALERGLVPERMFNPSQPHEDFGAWIRLMREGHVACGIDEPLATYRVHRGSRSSGKFRAARDRWGMLRDCTDEPLMRRAGLFASYALSGVRKYGKRRGSR